MKNSIFFLKLVLLLVAGIGVFSSCSRKEPMQILVFSKTTQFRHESIDAGKEAIKQMAAEKGFEADFTEDSEVFSEKNLSEYNAVIFLNTTGDVLNPKQQEAFERYIQAGGGYVGVHAATDTEYDWPWYGSLAGAYFLDHPMDPSNVQKGQISVVETNHWATEGMPEEFEWTDEFYSFKNISNDITPVLTIDESSYIGGKNPDFHPLSWFQEFNGGRSFYTALGHTEETYEDPLFLNHLWAGIKYAAGEENPQPLDYSKSRPEENRFTKVVLAEKLDEPMELTVLDKNRILFIQRKGEVMLYNSETEELKEIASIPVSKKYVNKEGKESVAEDGLLGLNKDPKFEENNWIYLFYSDVDKSANVLSRFTMDGDELLLDSKVEILEVPVQREECCHTGGSIAFDAEGNLYLSTGDNTNPHGSSGYSPSDERPGRESWDAQKSSSNTNDLRGKIIRIKPQPDGTYTIPEGNLFTEGTPKTRPEIYTMGHRNPFRISVDQKTGYVYWGDVGPDANNPDPNRGPAGHDEIGQARQAGNFGWPHFVGNNKAYNRYDFAKEESKEKWDPEAPINTSPNNTGLEQLPPARDALIWYPYGESPEFPLMGTGGRNAMAGPVFYRENFENAERPFPKYYDGKLIIYEWMRGFMMAVTLDEEGNYVSMEPFLPNNEASNPMDMQFGPNGDLYMLEYGSGWFTQNDDARLVKIEYNEGNRKPQVVAGASKPGGAVPLQVTLSAEGTQDLDEDPLKYHWTVTSKDGFKKKFNTKEAELTLNEVGLYEAVLKVDDGNGGVVTSKTQIAAGNELPRVTLEMRGSSRSFYSPGQDFNYVVKVSDKEDERNGNGIDLDQVAFTIDYLPEGHDKIAIAQGHRSADEGALLAGGKKLIAASDCRACHAVDKKSIGPSYREIALKYENVKDARDFLSNKIISGGSGVWGETPMAAHPDLSEKDAEEMTDYILSLTKEVATDKLPLKGSYTPTVSKEDPGTGIYILRASYTDQGANNLPPVRSEETVVLRNAKVDVHAFDQFEEVMKISYDGNNLLIPQKSGSYVVLRDVDLQDVPQLNLVGMAPKAQVNTVGGKVELRLGSPSGTKIGESEMLEPVQEIQSAPSVLNIPINLPQNAAKGLQDLYLVFVNPDALDSPIMVLMGTEFKLTQNK